MVNAFISIIIGGGGRRSFLFSFIFSLPQRIFSPSEFWRNMEDSKGEKRRWWHHVIRYLQVQSCIQHMSDYKLNFKYQSVLIGFVVKFQIYCRTNTWCNFFLFKTITLVIWKTALCLVLKLSLHVQFVQKQRLFEILVTLAVSISEGHRIDKSYSNWSMETKSFPPLIKAALPCL